MWVTLGFLRVLWAPRGGEMSCGSGGFPRGEVEGVGSCKDLPPESRLVPAAWL